MIARSFHPRSARDARCSPLCRPALGALLGLALIACALVRAASVGAAAPAGCVPINYTTCLSNGVYYVNGVPAAYITPYMGSLGYVNGNVADGGYPPNSVLFTYYDPRYGVVSVVTDAGGRLIDIDALTGQRIYPIYADYGYAADNVNGYYPGGYYGAGCPTGNDSCLAAYSHYGLR